MKKHTSLSIVLLMSGLSFSQIAISHPHDSPLTFRQHQTSDGRIIYSNIQKKCFSAGRLTCLKYHPIWKGGFTPMTSEHSDVDATAPPTTDKQ
ncbi:MAG: hypothetical protein GY806_19940 [Gammaproteobacteria bacterium]|nr:hypothetical protein [Gammaproteobacteria bacterium]